MQKRDGVYIVSELTGIAGVVPLPDTADQTPWLVCRAAHADVKRRFLWTRRVGENQTSPEYAARMSSRTGARLTSSRQISHRASREHFCVHHDIAGSLFDSSGAPSHLSSRCSRGERGRDRCDGGLRRGWPGGFSRRAKRRRHKVVS